MELYSSNEHYRLYQGNMLDMLSVLNPNSIDSIVTDPPYELNFMNKGWDNAGVSFQKETWQRCYDVLKPGGYLLAFGGSRTYHRIACAIEDAGFEIRDTIMWLYGSGFPKSFNIGKALESKLTTGSANTKDWKNLDGTKVKSGNWGISKLASEMGYRDKDYDQDGHYRLVNVEYTTEEAEKWDGWGSTLKPAYEPIIVARKPIDGTLVDNVLTWGVGGINIDECRIPLEDDYIYKETNRQPRTENTVFDNNHSGFKSENNNTAVADSKGRFPANIILTYDETDFDEVCGGFPNTKGDSRTSKQTYDKSIWGNAKSVESNCLYSDSGSAARYFYCAKASKRDRDEGLDEFETKSHEEINNRKEGSAGATRKYGSGTNSFLSVSCPRKNTHPTVKPTSLMQYLVRLITPNGGTILDPFNGSGSTGKAVMYENKDNNKNYKYIGIEMTDEYLPISKARIEFVCNGGIKFDKEDKKAYNDVVKSTKTNGRQYAVSWR